MSSTRETLHGLDLNERPSPIKKRLGDLTVRESSILADNDYVDIRLETDHEHKRKRKKTHSSRPPESPSTSSPDYLSSSFDSPTSQKGKLKHV